MYPNVHCSIVYNSHDMETTDISIDRGMDKDVIHRHSGILLSHEKRNEIILFAVMWMDLEIVY